MATGSVVDGAVGDADTIVCGVTTGADSLPGVADELGATGPAAGVAVNGCPAPVVRFVVQPNAAMVMASESAPRVRRAPRSHVLFRVKSLRI